MATKFSTILIELTEPFCGCKLAKEKPSKAFNLFLPDGAHPLRIQCKECGKEFRQRHSKLNGRVVYKKPSEPKQPEKRKKVIERAVESRQKARKAKPTSYLSLVSQLTNLGYSSSEVFEELKMRLEQHDMHMEEMDRHLAEAAAILKTPTTQWVPKWDTSTVVPGVAPEPKSSQPEPPTPEPEPEPPPKPDTRPAYMRALDLESQE